MVTHRIAHALLALAVRHWPGQLRDELHREWSAELNVLAADRHHWRMLRYAASLALARPARRSTTAATLLLGAWRGARLMLVAPLAAIALLAASLIGMNLIVGSLQSLTFAMDLQMPLVTLFSLASAVLLARLGRGWTLAGIRTVPLVLAVTVPGFTTGVLLYAGSNARKVELHTPGVAVFFLGLGAVLAAVSRIARTGRTRSAWWIGILGAIAVADIAVMLPLLSIELPPEESLHLAYAPVWLFTALTDSGFGLPHPTGMEIFSIGDAIGVDPLLFIAFSGLALGAVISAARQAVPAIEDQQQVAHVNP